MSRSGSRPAHRSERGITVVFFGIALTAMLAAGGLVLGGSVGYTAVRNAQTAADAAAVGGAAALREHKSNWVPEEGGVSAEQVVAEISSIAKDNGTEVVACDLVNARYAITNAEADVIDACDQLEFLSQEDFEEAAGVRVSVRDERDVPFAAFVDSDTITGSAVAAATAQPLGSLRAPFLLCTTFDESVVGTSPLTIDTSGESPKYTVNRDAIGEEYVLWGNPVKDDGRDCGMGASSWRGLADTAFAGTLGGWWETLTGNKTGQISARTNGVGDCDLSSNNLNSAPELIGCSIPVPLCVEGRGDSAAGFQLRCVALVMFEITHVKGSSTTSSTQCDPGGAENVVCGKLLEPEVASHGRGVASNPDDQIAVIKLVQ